MRLCCPHVADSDDGIKKSKHVNWHAVLITLADYRLGLAPFIY